MLEEFESEGYWWLPEHPESRAIGKLSYKLDRGIILEIDDTFHNLTRHLSWSPSSPSENPFSQKSETSLLLGKLANGKFVSLFKCKLEVSSFSFGSNNKEIRVISQYTLLYDLTLQNGFLIDENDLNDFKILKASFSFLREWVGLSALKISKELSPQGGYEPIKVEYKKPSNIQIGNVNTLELSLNFSVFFDSKIHKGNQSVSIEDSVCLEIANNQSIDFEGCRDIIIQFRDFLNFAVTYNNQIVFVRARNSKTDENYGSKATNIDIGWMEQKQIGITKQIYWSDMLFTYEDIEKDFGTIFKNWIDKRERFETVFQALLINIHTPNLYLEYKFLNIVQALESYHKISKKWKQSIEYISKTDYQEGIYKNILELIQNYPSSEENSTVSIYQDFKNFLCKKLEYLFKEDKSFMNRIGDILDHISEFYLDDSTEPQSLASKFSQKNVFFSKVKEQQQFKDNFLKKVRDTRHKLAHGDPIKITSQELYDLYSTLTIILQACLLIELEFPEEKVKEIIIKRSQNQREWQGDYN